MRFIDRDTAVQILKHYHADIKAFFAEHGRGEYVDTRHLADFLGVRYE